jgi:catechol 2,3-dioxygenase-like lactoylglutathione lyase family enzyme
MDVRIRHVAVRVADLHAAERFYRRLLDGEVAFREGHRAGEYGDLPDDVGWGDDATIETSFVERDEVVLALVRDPDAPTGTGAIDHLNVGVPADDLDALVDRARDLGCEVDAGGDGTPRVGHRVGDPYDRALLHDPYGLTWEFSAHER